MGKLEFRKKGTEPLPAKAGRFGELLKQPKDAHSNSFLQYYFSPISKLSELLLSCISWFLIYSLIISSVTFPLLATKYPLAHRCWPQNCLFSSLYSICSFLDVFPFIYCTSLLADPPATPAARATPSAPLSPRKTMLTRIPTPSGLH